MGFIHSSQPQARVPICFTESISPSLGSMEQHRKHLWLLPGCAIGALVLTAWSAMFRFHGIDFTFYGYPFDFVHSSPNPTSVNYIRLFGNWVVYLAILLAITLFGGAAILRWVMRCKHPALVYTLLGILARLSQWVVWPVVNLLPEWWKFVSPGFSELLADTYFHMRMSLSFTLAPADSLVWWILGWQPSFFSRWQISYHWIVVMTWGLALGFSVFFDLKVLPAIRRRWEGKPCSAAVATG